MQKWIFLKNISSNFAYIAPKLLSRTIINDDILLFSYPNYKKFHDERFCHFGQKSTLTGWNWRGPPTTPGRVQSDPKTLPTGKIHNYKSCWPTLGPCRYSWGAYSGPFGLKQALTGRKAPERPMAPHGCPKQHKTICLVGLHLYNTFWHTSKPFGHSLGAQWAMALWAIFCFTGPFLVKCCFDRNIGMWGVQIIATKCPDHFIQLQRILNHPIEENVQNFLGGALLRTKKPF